MSEAAVVIKAISKKYRLFNSPRDRLKEALHPYKHFHREFWALKDVSFEVPSGQTLGVLGRNGSGKSTLLQIIAGVMKPTTGEVITNGRVSALLELGAGFNPEFTGRENVILQGQVVGLSKEEISARLPEVEAFADIGQFFDQPTKVYSSGMFIRVAFAAAMSVDPEILVVDEALAVGDAKFQHKCYDRFAQLQQRGKTIIFVSHNINLVSSHCNRVILLEDGKLVSDGEPVTVSNHYIELLFGRKSHQAERPANEIQEDSLSHDRFEDDVLACFMSQDSRNDGCYYRSGYNPGETRITGSGAAEIVDYIIATDNGVNTNIIASDDSLRLLIKVKFHLPVDQPVIGFSVKTVDGIEIYGTNTYLLGIDVKKGLQNNVRVFQFSFRSLFTPGDYFIDLGVAEVDGTPGGSVIDVRRSVIHATFVGERFFFSGLVNLSPCFADLCKTKSE